MRKLFVGLFSILVLSTTGCAAVTALSEPSPRDLSVLDKGTPRIRVVSELGNPVYTENLEQGGIKDLYSFKPGAPFPFKFGRFLFHVGADIFTLCIWEAIAWPSEKACTKQEKKAEVTYDTENKVVTSELIKK